MNRLIDWSFDHARTVLILFLVILTAGGLAYVLIPKESTPEIKIPTFYVSVAYEGISPDDAERLLVRPLETQFQSLAGLRQMRSTAAEGYANVTLEFEAGAEPKLALDDVRNAVDVARGDLPGGANDPVVREVNTALFPILSVMISGSVPERTLVGVAEEMKTTLEALPGVLEVDIGGKREELLEVLVEPSALDSYNISFESLLNQIQRNNRLVAAGAIDTGAGRLTLKVPGVIENVEDVARIPVKVEDGAVVTLGDIAMVRRTFRDPTGFARIDGQPAVALEIKKRSGANIIETVAAVRATMEQAQANWPETVQVSYLQDQSEQVETLLGDLQNNVLTAILLVMIVIIAALGLRSGILVGLAIPGAFLAGIAALNFMGHTMNIIVLFALILVVGMLVDAAIVTVEYAERRLARGVSPRRAYADAAKRMAWPIISSTATTLAVFVPLLFWSGAVGQFMKFLPITVILTLTASLAMALVFVPVLGGVMGRRGGKPVGMHDAGSEEDDEIVETGGFTGAYARLLEKLLRHPGKTLGVALVLLASAYAAYGAFGRGVTFFPAVEPEVAQIQITSRDNLSIWEKDALVRRVEARVEGVEGIESVYSRTIGESRGSSLSDDVIGVLQLDFFDWDQRRPAAAILDEIRRNTSDVAGVGILVQEQQSGPSQGKPIQLRLTGNDARALALAATDIGSRMSAIGGFVDIEDSLPRPGVEWRLAVDREEAARYGADVTLLGQAVQMLTGGLQLAEYRPDDANDEVDIRVRFPADQRNLERLEHLRLSTSSGLVPIRNFVDIEPAPRTGTISRIDGQRTVTIEAALAEGALVADKVSAIRASLTEDPLPAGVAFSFAGEAEDQAEAGIFLVSAFFAAIFLMLMVLVTQFNSLFQVGLVLSAIVFSTAGVLLGLLVTGQPFGIVMGGIAVIALAGIVVNNNIVLIDCYNELRARGQAPREAALRAAALRLRPVLLTSVTTALGLMPMALGMNIDLVGRSIQFGAPSGQYWTALSSAIVGGLSVATLLTLVLTPCLLALGARAGEMFARRIGTRRNETEAELEAVQA